MVISALLQIPALQPAAADTGMEPQWLTVIIVGLGLVLTLIINAVTLTSKLGTARKEIDGDAERRQREVMEELRSESRMMGETVSAIRQELANHKLYSAENYQRRDSYHQQMTAFNTAMNARFEKIEDTMNARFEKIDDKLDKIFQRLALGDGALRN